MASLQARHSRRGLHPWSRSDPITLKECSCDGGPTYYVVVRQGTRISREKAGKNRREAERKLRAVAVAEDEGSFAAARHVRFDAFADGWLTALQRKPTTRDSYASTIRMAQRAF